MDFHLCQNDRSKSYSNNDCYLIIEDLWNISTDINSMDNHDEYFNWANEIRIEDEKCNRDRDSSVVESKSPRKRKLSSNTPELLKLKNVNGFKSTRGPACVLEESEKIDVHKRTNATNGTSKMPSWQVDDISDLNADLEGSLTALGGGDLSNGSYNMNSEAILAGLPVFKQEAPSPTSNDVGALQHVKQNRHSPNCLPISNNQASNTRHDSQGNQNIFNNSLHHLLGTPTYSNVTIDGNNRNSNPLSLDNYQISNHLAEDCRFQYVLAAATSIATKVNEDTLTYLNQGQSYEIKLKKLGDLSTYRGKLLKTIIRICFHERRLQYMEKEQMTLWQQSRPGDRILEVDVPLSYGLCDVVQPLNALNSVIFSWDPTKEVGVYIKVNCISTEFTPKKHGGEKGVPFRIQIETYQASENIETSKRLHAAACQIKVFKLKGADRKHKQDREKILKRPISEQEKYQPSYDCTVLTDIPYEAVVANVPAESSNTVSSSYSPENRNNNCSRSNNPLQNQIEDANLGSKLNSQELSPTPSNESTYSNVNTNVYNAVGEPLMSNSLPQMTAHWLSANRFEKHLATFSNFSGADMLRMSRDDLIQICGHADGIRLYNALHSKAIAPKLTIYICRENTTVFNAVYLTAHNNIELLQKLSSLTCVPQDQIRDIYMQGPQSIHVHLSNDVIKHIKEETMFSLEIAQDSGSYIFILKPIIK